MGRHSTLKLSRMITWTCLALPGFTSAGPAASPRPQDPGHAGRIGVFLRCTGEEDPRRALAAVKELGLDLIQISRLPDRYYTPEGAREFSGLMKAQGIRASSAVIVFDGESYRDRESVERTVGFRPLHLIDARLAYARRVVDFAAATGTKVVTFHMGFLPQDPGDEVYKKMLAAVSEIAGYAASRSVTVSLETGQETGEDLAQFLDRITVARVGVNFDTANLILYGLDSPPRALRSVVKRVTSVHVKDGLPPGDARLLGREARLGEGKAGVRECLRILDDSGFQGPLIIENYMARSSGEDPGEEMRRAVRFLRQALSGGQ